MGFAVPACDDDSGYEEDQDAELRYSGEELFSGLFFNVGPAAGQVSSLSVDQSVEQIREISDEEWAAALAQGSAYLQDEGYPEMAEALSGLSREEALERYEVSGNDVSALLMSMVAAEDPTFFERFGERVQSGDHYLVDEAMKEAGEKLIAAVGAIGAQTNLEDADAGFCFCAAIVSVANVVVGINVVAAGNVAVVLNVAAAVSIAGAVTIAAAAAAAVTAAIYVNNAVAVFSELEDDHLRHDVIIDEIATVFAS